VTGKSYVEKLMRVTFVLENNAKFPGTNSNTLKLEGLRTGLRAKSAGFPAFPDAEILVYGMALADMNALVSLAFQPNRWTQNSVLVEANSGNGWSVAYSGQILDCFPDYSGAPEVPLRLNSRMLWYQSIAPATPVSYTGATDVATIVQAIATNMGFAFENNGVDVQLSNPYFPGSLSEQLRAVCSAANIALYLDAAGAQGGSQNAQASPVVAIAPFGKPRNVPVWNISPKNGLVGYPMRDANGFINLRTLYNPGYRYGGLLNLSESGIVNAAGFPAYDINTGNWLISRVEHHLEAKKFGGDWFSDLLCYPPGVKAGAFST